MNRKSLFITILLAAVLFLSGCSLKNLSSKETPVYSISNLLETVDYNLMLPTEVPTGFLQTGITLTDNSTVIVHYSNGDREILLLAASKDDDSEITSRIGKDESTLLEINGYAVAFYPTDEELEQPGLSVWSGSTTSYCLTNATPQEAAGMLYSLKHANTLTNERDLGRPEQWYPSAKSLGEITGCLLTEPVTLADDFRFERYYSVGGLISAADYVNSTDTLTWQASTSELIYTPVRGSECQKAKLFSGTDHEFTVRLIYAKGETFRPEAQWEINGIYYKLTCTGTPSREKMLTLVRELAAPGFGS